MYQEALQMRDSTKSVLSKQEQTTIASNKSRDRQAAEFRRQVDERKSELERLERKIFSTGTKIIHQESGASSGKLDEDAIICDNKAQMEANFKKLMTVTGVTVSHELVDRFLAQREASARLTYLRNVTEHEKKRLESQREQMTQQLDIQKFSRNQDSEVYGLWTIAMCSFLLTFTIFSNQEELERVKKDIEEQKRRKKDFEMEAQRKNIVLQSIKDALVEMLLKLQEVDEMTAEIQAKRRAAKPLGAPLPDLVSGNISTEQIVKMLEEKVKVGMIALGQLGEGVDSGLSDEEEDVIEVKPIEPPKEEGEAVAEGVELVKSASITNFAIDEKPAAYPQVYSSLITGRSTGLVSASPGAGGGKQKCININANIF